MRSVLLPLMGLLCLFGCTETVINHGTKDGLGPTYVVAYRLHNGVQTIRYDEHDFVILKTHGGVSIIHSPRCFTCTYVTVTDSPEVFQDFSTRYHARLKEGENEQGLPGQEVDTDNQDH